MDDLDLEALGPEAVGDRLGEADLVLDDQHPHEHESLCPARRRPDPAHPESGPQAAGRHRPAREFCW